MIGSTIFTDNPPYPFKQIVVVELGITDLQVARCIARLMYHR